MTQLMSDEGGSTIIGRGNTMIGPLARSAEAGDLDKAFELLQGALDVRDPGLVHLAVAPQWDRLRRSTVQPVPGADETAAGLMIGRTAGRRTLANVALPHHSPR